MFSSLRKPVIAGVFAGAVTALAVFGGTGAFLAAAQDNGTTAEEPATTQAPDTTEAPDTTQALDTTEAPDTTQAPEATTPDTTAPDDQAPSTEDPRQQAEAWRQCMADHGIDLSQRMPGEGRHQRPQIDDSQRQAFQDAIEACGAPVGRGGPHHKGGAGCPGMGDDKGSAPDQSTPNDTAPSVDGASFRV